MDMMADLHGPQYDLFQTFCEPADVGFGASARKRTYVIGVHKERCSILKDPLELQETLRMSFSLVPPTQPRDYLVATEVEVRLEAQDLCRRRGLYYQDTRDLRYLLTERERDALSDYEMEYFRKYGRLARTDANLLVYLGDNPAYSLTWSANGRVPTFRRNPGLLWSPKYCRWLTARERLVSMGWPVHSTISESMGVRSIPATDIKRASDLAGNAMHFLNAGVQQLVALSCFGPDCPSW